MMTFPQKNGLGNQIINQHQPRHVQKETSRLILGTSKDKGISIPRAIEKIVFGC